MNSFQSCLCYKKVIDLLLWNSFLYVSSYSVKGPFTEFARMEVWQIDKQVALDIFLFFLAFLNNC